jgi:hypothetical protein
MRVELVSWLLNDMNVGVCFERESMMEREEAYMPSTAKQHLLTVMSLIRPGSWPA